VDSKTNIFLLHGYGKANMDNYEMFEKLLDSSANVYVISNDEYFKDYEKTFMIPICEEVISPFALIETMQLFSLGLSVKKGLNPDKPRGLKKVTITK
jgi:glucosamine--fructose-6-phosphate aminotransferase (isomerizing)